MKSSNHNFCFYFGISLNKLEFKVGFLQGRKKQIKIIAMHSKINFNYLQSPITFWYIVTWVQHVTVLYFTSRITCSFCSVM